MNVVNSPRLDYSDHTHRLEELADTICEYRGFNIKNIAPRMWLAYQGDGRTFQALEWTMTFNESEELIDAFRVDFPE
jgi:hypothetical protein